MKDKGIPFQILKTDKVISKPARLCLEEVHINGMSIHSAKSALGVPGVWSQPPSQSIPTVGTLPGSCWAPGSSARGAEPLPWEPGGAAPGAALDGLARLGCTQKPG